MRVILDDREYAINVPDLIAYHAVAAEVIRQWIAEQPLPAIIGRSLPSLISIFVNKQIFDWPEGLRQHVLSFRDPIDRLAYVLIATFLEQSQRVIELTSEELPDGTRQISGFHVQEPESADQI